MRRYGGFVITRRATVALAVAMLAGCSAPGALVAEHAPEAPVGVRRVERAGRYQLFVDGDAASPAFPLAAGDPIGFDHSATTLPTAEMQIEWLYGVAGTNRLRLDFRQTYQWRRLAERQ